MRKAHNAIDMTGKQYNSWLVIEPVPGTGKHTGGKIWKAKCLECEDVYSVKGANLRSGLSKRCVKCGCGHAHSKQKGQARTKRTPKESAFYYLFLKLRRDARKRKIDWQLTEEQTNHLVLQNCVYCGIQPSLQCQPLKHNGLSQKRTEAATILRNGIDRVDSNLGYTIDNVVTACETCNKAKLDTSATEFKAWVERVYNYLHKI